MAPAGDHVFPCGLLPCVAWIALALFKGCGFMLLLVLLVLLVTFHEQGCCIHPRRRSASRTEAPSYSSLRREARSPSLLRMVSISLFTIMLSLGMVRSCIRTKGQ